MKVLYQGIRHLCQDQPINFPHYYFLLVYVPTLNIADTRFFFFFLKSAKQTLPGNS